MSKTVILSAARTPFGKFGGTLKDVKAQNLEESQLRKRLKGQMFPLVMLKKLYLERLSKEGKDKFHHVKQQERPAFHGKCKTETINKVCASGLRSSYVSRSNYSYW